MFDNLKKSLESESSLGNKKYIETKFTQVEYRLQDILLKLDKVNELSDQEVHDLIINHYGSILNYDFFLISDNSRSIVQKAFTNKRFLFIFLDNAGCINLNKNQIICVNKLAYDYYILDNKDPDIKNLLMQISYKINYRLVIVLSAKLGMNNARALSMICNSSFKTAKNIHRTHVFLCKCTIYLSVKDLVDILCIIFGNDFNQLFVYTMLELPAEGTDMDRYNDISSAILSILASLPTEDIKKVLYNYSYIVEAWNVKEIRFSMKEVKQERIVKAMLTMTPSMRIP